MTIACLAASLWISAAAPVQDLDSRLIGATKVPLVWPDERASLGSVATFPWGGRQVAVGPRGEILGIQETDSPWADARAAYARARGAVGPTTPAWRVKVVLPIRADILNHGEILRTRRMTLDRPEVDAIYRSLALFGALAEGATDGAIQVTVEVESESDTAFQDSSPDRRPFDDGWLRGFLEARVNGHDFHADDKVYRGPYSSIFVIHPGLVGHGADTTIAGMPAHAVPYFQFGRGYGETALPRRLFELWGQDVAHAARRNGVRWPGAGAELAGPRLDLPFPPGFLAAASAVPTDPTGYAGRWNSKGSIEGRDWTGRQGLDGFPALSKEDLGRIAQAELEIRPVGRGILFSFAGRPLPMSVPTSTLDARFEPGAESAAVVPFGARSMLFVSPWAAALYASELPANRAPRFHGFAEAAGRAFAIFTIETPASGLREASLLGRDVAAAEPTSLPEVTGALFDPATRLPTAQGYLRVASSRDGERGTVAQFTFEGPIRIGRALLFDTRSAGATYDARLRPIVSLWVKSAQSEPLVVRFESGSPGWAGAAGRLFGAWPVAEESGVSPIPDVPLAADGEWRLAKFDLRGLAPTAGQMKVSRIWLETDPAAALWSPRALGDTAVLVGAMTVEAGGPTVAEYPALSPPAPDPNSTDREARARWAFGFDGSRPEQIPILVGLLKDRADLVKLNAAAALARFPYPKGEPALVDALATLDPRVAQHVLLALRAQGTEYSWNAIERALIASATDWHKFFGAPLLADRKDIRSAGTLSGLYASRSWQVRRAAVQTLARFPGRDPSLMVAAFLQESSPEVRLAATRGANTEQEIVCRRVLYSSVNDTSEAVRAASFLRLIASPIAAFEAEGYKGVRDDSPWVRLAVLEYLREQPREGARGALRLAVADSNPEVRAAALLAFAKIPGPVSREEVENCWADPDPRVASALVALRSAKGIGEPAPVGVL